MVLIKTLSGIDYVPLSSIYNCWKRTELFTPDGFRPIQRMKETSTIYKNISVNGLIIQASPEHIFPVKQTNKHLQELPLKMFKTGSLIWNPMEYDLPDTRFNFEDGWFLGFYLAEGYRIRNSKTAFRFVTGLHEKAYRDKIENYAKNYGTVWHTLQDHNAVTGVHSERLRNMLEFFSKGFDATTKELVLEQVLNTSKTFRQGIIEGFYNGDGSKDGKRKRLCTTSELLSEQLMLLASTIGLYGSRHFSKSSGYGGQGSWIVDLRSNTRSQFWINNQALARIKAIKQVNAYQTMYDLQVEGGLFCIQNGILTHNSAGDLKGSFGNKYEVIFLGTKGKGWKYKGERLHDIWQIDRVGTQRIHPTQKPVALYERIINISTDEGTLIFDPYLGSGSSVIAAMKTGRNFLGYEIDEEYYRRIQERIAFFEREGKDAFD